MKENLTKKILFGLVVGDAIFIAASSPYFLINIARAYAKNKNYKKYKQRKVAQTFAYLKQKLS